MRVMIGTDNRLRHLESVAALGAKILHARGIGAPCLEEPDHRRRAKPKHDHDLQYYLDYVLSRSCGLGAQIFREARANLNQPSQMEFRRIERVGRAVHVIFLNESRSSDHYNLAALLPRFVPALARLPNGLVESLRAPQSRSHSERMKID